MTPAHTSDNDFAIAADLLTDNPPPLAWSNLGDWTGTTDYTQACRQLAWRVGNAANLRSDDHVLDMACGNGASLSFWTEAFDVRRISALELQAPCIDKIRRQPPPHLVALAQGRFDTLPAPNVFSPQSLDAAVCVDAAYHATSLQAFAAFAAHLLRPQGRLAFTTLVLPDTSNSRVMHALLLNALAQARVPAASLQTESAVIDILSQQGFTDIAIDRLDTEVLHGFHSFVQRRSRELSWSRKTSPAWLKIQATAWLCRHLYKSGALHYCLISATRR